MACRNLVVLAALIAGCGEEARPGEYRVAVANVSVPGQYAGLDVTFAAGVWAVLDEDAQLFPLFGTASPGLVALAEQADRVPLLNELADREDVVDFGALGVDGAADIGPGQGADFEVTLWPGEQPAFVAEFGHTHDIVLASEPGAELVPSLRVGESVLVSTSVWLYDAGTRDNDYPGTPGPGEPERASILHVPAVDGDLRYPAIESMASVAVERLH